MRVCTVSRKGLRKIYQDIRNFIDFLKIEEEREGKEKICLTWKSLSEEEIKECKDYLNKIRRLVDRIEEYIDKCRL
jgi:predicted transcriptional regulator